MSFGPTHPIRAITSALLVACASEASATQPAVRGATGDEPSHIEIYEDLSAILTLPRAPAAIEIADPELATISALSSDRTQMIRGLTVGETVLTIASEGAEDVRYTIAVSPVGPEGIRSGPSREQLRLRAGASLRMELPVPSGVIAVSNPSVVRLGESDPRSLELWGLAPGVSDVVIQFGTVQPMIYRLTITE